MLEGREGLCMNRSWETSDADGGAGAVGFRIGEKAKAYAIAIRGAKAGGKDGDNYRTAKLVDNTRASQLNFDKGAQNVRP